MARALKVFCKGRDQAAVADKFRVVERYTGFVVLSVSAAEAKAIARRYPVEDISKLYAITAGGKKINTNRPRIDRAGRTLPHPFYRGVRKLGPGRHHYLVQFVGPIKEAWLRGVRRAGGELRTPYQDFAYVVRAAGGALARVAALPYVRWLGHFPYAARIGSSVAADLGLGRGAPATSLPRTRLLPASYLVEFFGARDAEAAVAGVKQIGLRVLGREDRVLIVQMPSARSAARRIRALSAIHGVKVIRDRAIKRPSNDVAARIMGTARSMKPSGLGLSGRGEVVAVCDTGIDTGDPKTIHKDFAGRIAWVESYPISEDYSAFIHNPGGDDGPGDFDSGHGTHVSGSVLGSGAASVDLELGAPVRGLAYEAELVFQAVEQELDWKDPSNLRQYGRYLLAGLPLDLTTLFRDAYRKRARIHSNSWGGGAPGAYDAQCEQLDRFVWEHKDFLVLVAAGNDGSDRDGDGRINPMSVTSPATAKNCITVGACESLRPEFATETYGSWWDADYPVAPFKNDPMADDSRQVVAFSSRGPTRDGRLKPEVVAPGTFILSTRSTQIAPNNFAWGAHSASHGQYFFMGGTSMATPLAAGAVAIIREYLRKARRMAKPSAALLKAAVILGAQRLPDRLTDREAAERLADNDQGFGRVDLDEVLAPRTPARASFVEPRTRLGTGDVYNFEIEVRSNRVPLRIVLAYSDYPGLTLVNNLNLIAYSPVETVHAGNQPSGTLTMDTANNVEVIEIRHPAPGKWRIAVVGSNVAHGPQDFALAYKADAEG